MVEPKDTVSSEILNFTTTEEDLKKDLGGNGSDEEKYTCLLGADGQVILWNEECETVISRFPFTYPPHLVKSCQPKSLTANLDQDGDLDVVRKNKIKEQEGVVLIEHHRSSTLDLVGEQIWRGALYLGDYILHNSKIFKDKSVLEVAAGVGFTSLVTSMFAKQIVATDIDKGDILEFIARNFVRNKDLIKSTTHIEELNFYDTCTIEDIENLLTDTTILLAADIVYHNHLTEAFFKAILYLMKRPPSKTLYISLEKRYVFTIEDMDTVAPCYDYFLERLTWLTNQETSEISWNVEEIKVDFPQYFSYERNKHLVLWKIEANLVN